MRRVFSMWVLSSFVLILSISAAFSACSVPLGNPDIVVGIRDAVPFTKHSQAGRPHGMAVALWEDVALTLMKDNKPPLTEAERKLLTPEAQAALRPTMGYAICETIDEQEAAIAAGLIDVVISPLTITADRMTRYDFSQQYLSSGLALALPRSNAIDFGQAKKVVSETLLQPTVARAIVGFLIFNLAMAFLIRAFLIGQGGRFFIGAQHILESVTRTIGLRGVGDNYTSAIAKLLEIFMAIVGTALSATFLGVLTTAFVDSIGQVDEVPAAKFTKMRIATLKCSTAQEYLFEQYEDLGEKMGADDPLRSVLQDRLDWLACDKDTKIEVPTEMSVETRLPGAVVLARSWEEAMRRLQDGEVDAVLGDWVAMTYLVREGALKDAAIDVQSSVYRNEPYGWAIARKPGFEALRTAIDSALISQMRDVGWRARLETHLGIGSVAPN